MSARADDAPKEAPAADPTHEERLVHLVGQGDPEGCVAFLLGLKEKQRRALHPRADLLVHQDRGRTEGPEPFARHDAACLSWIATAGNADLRVWLGFRQPWAARVGLVCDVIAARFPAGSAELERVTRSIHSNPGRFPGKANLRELWELWMARSHRSGRRCRPAAESVAG